MITLTDDQQLEKLKKSSQELVKRIKKEKSRIYSFALAGIDPNIPADNNEIAAVKETFEKIWPTYAAITRDTPIPFIRAVILNSLLELAADVAIANLIYLSIKDVVKYLKFSPVEEVTIKVFLSDIADKITIEANEKFRIRHAINNNNLLENRFRPVALGRKNWLFAGNHQSAERSGIIYSILQSCALHKIEPHSYISHVLTRLPSLLYAPNDKIDELLPGNWKPNAVKLYPTSLPTETSNVA